MGANSKIEWTDATWNPVTGCSRISPGCKNCYAEEMAKRLQGTGVKGYEKGFQVTLHPERLNEPLHWKKPRKVFVVSMGDLFHDDVPWNHIYKVFEMMLLCPQHIFLVLTKRAPRLHEVEDIWLHIGRNYPDAKLPLNNVWGGVTVEDSAHLCRIDMLLQTRFSRRFVSVEPMLGPVRLTGEYLSAKCGGKYPFPTLENQYRTKIIDRLDWVICGGESGRNARPMHPEWARSLRDQCQTAGVPFFFKQYGEWGPLGDYPDTLSPTPVCFYDESIVGTIPGWQDGISSGGQQHMVRVGKKRTGRILDGREWSEFPEERG